MYNYGIGGQEVPKDASEAIADIPQNRTLMIEKLTADDPLRPQVAEGLKTVEEVFEHFKPTVDVDFEKEDGSQLHEELSFSNLGDFGAKGITNQSSFLNGLNLESKEYAKIVRQLKSNKLLRAVLENPDAKKAFTAALQSLITEIGND